MQILLTNDDGIHGEGLRAIYKELSKISKVTVVAPDSERSSVGHGITLAHPLWVQKVKVFNKNSFYGISGTPADCVKVALRVILKKKPDLIISGINLGPNCGYSVFYSGTIAAAREGAMLGIPSIAISLATFNNPDFSYAAVVGAKLAKIFNKMKLPEQTFLNVNVPNKKSENIKGMRIVRQSIEPIHSKFLKRKDPYARSYYWLSASIPAKRSASSHDIQALRKGYVTITPIHCDLTDYSFLDELKKKSILF